MTDEKLLLAIDNLIEAYEKKYRLARGVLRKNATCRQEFAELRVAYNDMRMARLGPPNGAAVCEGPSTLPVTPAQQVAGLAGIEGHVATNGAKDWCRPEYRVSPSSDHGPEATTAEAKAAAAAYWGVNVQDSEAALFQIRLALNAVLAFPPRNDRRGRSIENTLSHPSNQIQAAEGDDNDAKPVAAR